ncbi:MAG: alpha/beta hydrolase [Opitutaceae bacterium]|nr:alpha/beta hydrolase [Opitutaceae bacterium]
MRVLLLLLSAHLLAFTSLTFFPAPRLWLWKAALLVGEFGHWLVVFPAAIAWVAWRAGGSLAPWTLALCLATVLALLRPGFLASRISGDLAHDLAKAFGKVSLQRPAFAWTSLFARAPQVAREEYSLSRPGSQEPLALAYYRAQTASLRPCVVVIHGGGWDNGDNKQLASFNELLASKGFNVAAVSYRLAPRHEWPSQLEDLAVSLEWLKQHASELSLDANRFVIVGRSAGGQLATAFAYTHKDPAIRGAVSLYGPQDLVFAWQYSREDDLLNATKLLRQFLGGSPSEQPARYESSSPYLFATRENAVPTLLVHGRIDALVWHRQSERMHARLQELGVPSAFLSLPWATHACEVNPSGPSGQLTLYALEWFLKAVADGPGR